MPINLSHAAMRLATGAFILNSGIGKLHLDHDNAEGLKSMAANAFPALKNMEADQFGKLLSLGEISVGAALLTPFIPSRLAGLVLAGFSASLLRMYFKTPALTEADGIRPSQAGTPVSKDVWMLGIAAALILDRKHKTTSVSTPA
ncbi:hypothetical protein IV498_01545 [Paenarthrobacter sp. Z7-10]|uniref:hypothetical protein n=1 Tax=Paenarthrobacter sp. Z7-10 TaxID=2787635 RepID=UPI0022A9DF37|nr:hypothetical protein [Paenarthrobacter sp. Z7-10]MCZ2401899.1 hypothetical protein [Paenarthrobacter sp. Z7-10]